MFTRQPELYLPEFEQVEGIVVPSMIQPEIAPYDFKNNDINGTIIQLIPVTVERARGTLPLFESHRGFGVAATGIAVDTDPADPRIALISAANFKKSLPDDQRDDYDVESISKFCAEMEIEMIANLLGFKRIALFAIIATQRVNRIEGVNKVESATLHPCQSCGSVLKKSPIVDDNTVLFTVGSAKESNVCQVQTVKEYDERYAAFYAGKAFEDATQRRYTALGWDVKRDDYLNAVKNMSKRPTESAKQKLMARIIKQSLSQVN